ncbi:alpha/beta fold hydrolase [Maribacter spongiicola]|uniref:alpha/beta fold hydrolase n=1 Tax=Maribacter spongiicola TaxID=1206753 RepID=UPI003F9E239B
MDILKRNNVKVFGNGTQVIMFAHGFGCDQNMWRFISPAFVDDYKIVQFDYVGCGNSDTSAYNEGKYGSLYGYAQDVLDICDVLNLQNVIFIGHSVSSMIGVLASLQAPKVFKNLILVSPSSKYIDDTDYVGGFSEEDLEGLLDVMDNNYTGWAKFLALMVMKNAERPELTEELENSFCAADPAINRNFARVTFFSDNRDDIVRVKLPTLILQCSDDDIAPDTVGEFIHKKISGSTIVRMNATGHCPHMSHPEETIAAIKNFLTKAG